MKQKLIHIPILKNFKGESPLHIALKKQDYKSIDIMLKYLSGYDIDHHSRAIEDLLPMFIEKEVPELKNYLISRVIDTKQTLAITKGLLKQDYKSIIENELWFRKLELDKQIIEETAADNSKDQNVLESRIKC